MGCSWVCVKEDEMSTDRNAGWKPGDPIGYINPEVPQVALPAYEGKRREVLVPDTLDLQDMARLAINGMTAPTDPLADHELYWWATFNSNPPMIHHSRADECQAKHMEAVPLLRLVSGSDQNLHVEQRWIEVMLQMQGPDGVLYCPKIGRPWVYWTVASEPEPPGDHYISPCVMSRLPASMGIYYELTGDPVWKEAARKVVDGLIGLAEHDGDMARVSLCAEGSGTARIVHALSDVYRCTGYEPALELAGKMANWVMKASNRYDDDGRFLKGAGYSFAPGQHFHGHTIELLGLVNYGMVAGDEEALEFARRGFEYGMTQGECTLGYFPEWLGMGRPQTLEVCELADMIGLAVKLSQSGAGDYWDMADRWTRNLFYEGQLRRAERLNWMSEKSAPSGAPVHWDTPRVEPTIPPYHSAERAIERNIGSFGGWLSPNDFFPHPYPHNRKMRDVGIMHCCTGNGARAIYYIWEGVLTHEKGRLRVNLLLNRASEWADVDSHIPYAGQVDITVKQPVDLSVRIPEWVQPGQTGCTVTGEPRPLSWEGRYAAVGPVREGDVVTLKFPIGERDQSIDVQQRTYRILLRGNTCVAVDPPGVNYPLFQRDHYRTDTRWRKVDRFVSEKVIEW